MNTGRGESIRQLIASLWQRGLVNRRGAFAPYPAPQRQTRPILLICVGKPGVVGRLDPDGRVTWQRKL